MLNKKMWTRQLGRSLRKIERQLNITIEHYKKQEFNESYKEVRLGVDENQYVPNWVPGMGNVLIHFGQRPTKLKVSSYIPSLHTELQQFSVAMEAIVQSDSKRTFLIDTNRYLIQFLCEVEESLVVLQIGVPAREQRSLMGEEERNPPDMTRRLIRDWGILIKYRDYLHYWNILFSKMNKHHKKHKEMKQTSRKKSSTGKSK